MNFLNSLIPYLAPLLAGILVREIALGAKWAIEKLRGSPKTAALAEAVGVVQDTLDAGVTAASDNAAHPKVIAQAMLNAVKDAALSPDAKQKLLQAAQEELQNLVNPGVTTATVADGNATVNVPLPGQSK